MKLFSILLFLSLLITACSSNQKGKENTASRGTTNTSALATPLTIEEVWKKNSSQNIIGVVEKEKDTPIGRKCLHTFMISAGGHRTYGVLFVLLKETNKKKLDKKQISEVKTLREKLEDLKKQLEVADKYLIENCLKE